ncbi:HlyD family secretion protein, partial [Arsenicitalea aurantiaca]
EQLVGSSGDAYVNAPLATIRAPINGTLQLSTAPLGGRVRAGDAMGSVSARAVADATLSGLEEGRLLAEAELAAQEAFADEPGASGFGARLGREQARLRAEALNSAVEQRRAALPGETAAALRAPVGGVVWSRRTASGEFVTQGEELASLADCATLYVHASVDERLYNRLRLGDVAQFRFHDGQVVDATVALLAGTGPRTLLETLAISPTERQREGFAVLLSAPGIGANGACPLGRTGRVIFSEGPLSGIRNALEAVGF